MTRIVDPKPVVPIPIPDTLEHLLTNARLVLAEHAQRVLHGEAASAFHFIGSTVEAAARAQVLDQVTAFCTTNTNANLATARAGIRTYANSRAKTLAERGAVKSTNPIDAALHAEELCAWLAVAEAFQ